ncbi:MAG: DegT/DnrJ/EryC1/StrS family aminotransferase [Sulfuricaulis sp.]|nr:DegT/DnrJ/EryC1/StrS family aminotransferase [Sulfuricaulis sp.]
MQRRTPKVGAVFGPMNPYAVTRQLEDALCIYTGAPYACALNSCTAALLLAVQWCDRHEIGRPMTGVNIPRRTYVSVPCAIKLAGCFPTWRDEDWRGQYQLRPFPIMDSARRFTSHMYRPNQFQCVSFAAAKILGAEQGGAILHDNAEADAWFRRMRFDGRTEGVDPLEDTFDLVAHHCIMIPSIAATLLVRLHHLPKVNADLPHYEYPDLSKHKAFA